MTTAKTLTQDLYERRLTPAEHPEDPFGELRSMAHEAFTGGERWEDWAPLFERMEAPSGRLWEYLNGVWRPPVEVEDEETARRAFVFRALEAHARALREADCYPLGAPMTTAQVEAWLEQASFPTEDPNAIARPCPTPPTLPPYLQACLLELGAGTTADEDPFSWFRLGQGMSDWRGIQPQNDLGHWTLLKRYEQDQDNWETVTFPLAVLEQDHPSQQLDEAWELHPLSAYVLEMLERAPGPYFELEKFPSPSRRRVELDRLARLEGDLRCDLGGRSMTSIITRGRWADHVVEIHVTDEPFIGDTDIDVAWWACYDHTEEGEPIGVCNGDHACFPTKSRGHLLDILDERLRGERDGRD